MKIDKNNKTPLYGPNEVVPQKLRDFYASTAMMQTDRDRYRKVYDNIKPNKEIDDKFEIAFKKGNKTTYKFK